MTHGKPLLDAYVHYTENERIYLANKTEAGKYAGRYVEFTQ
jgi:hypothetical protein